MQLSRTVAVMSLSLLFVSAAFGQKSVPVFRDGEAQAVAAFSKPSEWIREELWVETEFNTDGDDKPDRMHVAVVRHKQTETEGLKVPAIYITSPYFAGTGSTSPEHMWNPRVELGAVPPMHKTPPPAKRRLRPGISNSHVNQWVPLGYAVVHSSSPGTGLSQGCPTVGGDNESLAPKAVIDWLNGRAKGFTTVDGDKQVYAKWCTGKVGMTGTSYNGTLPLAAATTGVEGLEAIIPIAPNTSYYHYYRSNGLVRHPGGYMGEDIDVLYNFIHTGDPAKREYCDCEVRDKGMLKRHDRVTGDYNDFWAERDYLNELGPLRAATLMAHGFNDWNVVPEHSIRIYQAIREKGVPCQLYVHQAGHGGPPPMKLMNRWFTRYLFGIRNGVEKDPRAWIVREDKKPSDPTAYPDYPNPQAADVALYPAGGGRGVGRLGTSTPDQAMREKLIDDADVTGKQHAQAAESRHRLLYATDTLTAPLHISGTPRIRLRLASSKPATNLSVWLVSLPWTDGKPITANLITRGWADPQNRESLRESQPLVPGEFVDVEFALQPDDQIIPAGQQLGLMIFSSDHDFTLWPKAGTELTVDLQRTRLDLPVVGGSAAFQAATAPAQGAAASQ